MIIEGKTLVFFDDVCALCNLFVKHLLHLDKDDQLRFVSLSSEYAKSNDWKFDTDAVVVIDHNGQTYFAESAVLKLCQKITALKWLSLVIRMIPKVLRKFLYKMIATNRYKIFGKLDTCPLNSEINEKIII
jgi:predicted DCC family thiol-disulfide oxidoreductase YuxK